MARWRRAAHGPTATSTSACCWAAGSPTRARLRFRLKLAGELGAALHRNDVQRVILNDAPPLLAQRALSRGVLVFQRSRAARVRFQVATARRYDDMVPTMERYLDRLKQHVRQGRAGG